MRSRPWARRRLPSSPGESRREVGRNGRAEEGGRRGLGRTRCPRLRPAEPRSLARSYRRPHLPAPRSDSRPEPAAPARGRRGRRPLGHGPLTWPRRFPLPPPLRCHLGARAPPAARRGAGRAAGLRRGPGAARPGPYRPRFGCRGLPRREGLPHLLAANGVASRGKRVWAKAAGPQKSPLTGALGSPGEKGSPLREGRATARPPTVTPPHPSPP